MKWVNNYSPAQPSPGSPPSHKYIVPALYWSWTWNDLRIWYFIVPKLLLLSCSSCSPSCPLATVDCSYIIAACPSATLHSSKSQRMSTGIRIVEVVKGRKDSFNILYIWIDNRYCYLVISNLHCSGRGEAPSLLMRCDVRGCCGVYSFLVRWWCCAVVRR